jgi:acetoin utilization deacetylase AcuC-like enzyme
MRVSYSPDYVISLPERHPFPMEKFSCLHSILLDEGLLSSGDVYEPNEIPWKELRRVHSRDYLEKLRGGTLNRSEERRLGLPWSDALVRRSRLAVQGTLMAAKMALEDGISANLAGGTHHAFPGHGEGFCVLNDIAVTIKILLQEKKIKKALIIDLDVHQGNGTAEALKDDINTFTFSMHCGKNYPFVKANSDLDIELDEGTGDTEYLHVLIQHVLDVQTKVNPDIVFYLAGVDVVEGDRYGRLNLSRSGLQKREQFILGLMKRLSLPVVILMSGGYATTPGITADLHAEVHRAAYTFY